MPIFMSISQLKRHGGRKMEKILRLISIDRSNAVDDAIDIGIAVAFFVALYTIIWWITL
jgi:hypothetical protein